MYKLLIADDEKWVREGLKELIDWKSCLITEILEAKDGGEALELIRKHHPDIVITDIRMPDIDGIMLASVLRDEAPQIKVIVISGYQDFEYARQAVGLGVCDYILKPINEKCILETVKKCIIALEHDKERQKEHEVYLNWLNEENHTIKSECLKVPEGDHTEETESFKCSRRKVIQDVIHYIEGCYHKKISLATAAEHAFLNPSYLSKLFCEEVGEPFTRYLMRIRVENAKKMLEDYHYKIYEVSEKVGYCDIKYFVKVFKEIEGITPAEYREKSSLKKQK